MVTRWELYRHSRRNWSRTSPTGKSEDRPSRKSRSASRRWAAESRISSITRDARLNLVAGDLAVRLREMAHHRERGGEERGLGPFARVEDVGGSPGSPPRRRRRGDRGPPSRAPCVRSGRGCGRARRPRARREARRARSRGRRRESFRARPSSSKVRPGRSRWAGITSEPTGPGNARFVTACGPGDRAWVLGPTDTVQDSTVSRVAGEPRR